MTTNNDDKNVANNVAQSKVQDLTEQWKKGELENGFYYFRLPDGSIDIASEYQLIRYRLTKDADTVEVLSPVPSYEEYNRLKEVERKKGKLVNVNYKIKQENQQLKELLNQCKYELRGCYTDVGWEDWSLINKIDTAIGEKK